MNKEHLAVMIRERSARYGEKSALRFKAGDSWQSVSYREMGQRIEGIARALVACGVAPGERVGIFSENRPEWALADFAIHSVRGVVVPIYATNTARQAEFVVNDAAIRVLFVGSEVQLDRIASFIGANCFLQQVIVFDEFSPIDPAYAQLLKDFVLAGKAAACADAVSERIAAASADDLATLIYTSGTTGDPKGVMLSHANFDHQFDALDQSFTLTASDRSLCFLPLSHAYERTWSYYVFRCGAENNYLADPKQVVAALQEVKPTAMVSVPRLYEKIYSTVHERLHGASPLKRQMFAWALATGAKYHRRRLAEDFIGPLLALRYRLADRLVLARIRAVVGGDKNFFSAGGAPLAQEIEEFFLAAGILVCQGYGMTESSPLISYNAPRAFKFGTVGKAAPGCEVRIAENGEILARGPNIMLGYYGKPEATAEAIVDGWLKTGDVGTIDDEGYIRITDRIKDLIITSQGKNVAPQHVEMVIGIDHYIEQIATIGDRRSYLTALIVPAFAALEQYARANAIAFASRKELVARPEIVAFYRQRIDALSHELAAYEQIKRFTLLAEDFTQAGGELTPTLKIKRKVVAQKYRDQIEAMYGGE